MKFRAEKKAAVSQAKALAVGALMIVVYLSFAAGDRQRPAFGHELGSLIHLTSSAGDDED